MRSGKVVVFSGAGISAESGLRTFRDQDGLWDEYRIEEVATPEAWDADPVRVLHFYDLRREQVLRAAPNAAHLAIARLERQLSVQVITQNIDDLHERAGSGRVLHLHGEVRKARSTADPSIVLPIDGYRLGLGELCPLGSQLRPHVVWFGEEVPMIPIAAGIVAQADVLLVVGTSFQVHPAAGLLHYAPSRCTIHVVDPGPVGIGGGRVIHHRRTATDGVPLVIETILSEWKA